MWAFKGVFGIVASLSCLACVTAAPAPIATAPAFQARRPVVKLRKQAEAKATAVDWFKLNTWAHKQAGRLPDDIACTGAIRGLAERFPNGARSFALLVACTRQDKFRDIRMPFLRPWRKHTEALTPQQAARLLGQIISIRGGAVISDTRFTRSRGVFLDTLSASANEAVDGTTRFILLRGRVELVGMNGAVSIRETAASGRHLPTGNWLEVTAPGDLSALSGERVFLARRFAGQTHIIGVWPVGVTLPGLSDALTDKGVDAIEPRVERYMLDNGLTVILHQNHALPLTHVNLTYRVGAYHEAPGRSGFAHLFEHMMFQGSANVQRGEHFALLEGRGASLVNAYTGFDRTSYVQTVPSHELELALWLEADRMNSLDVGLTPVALENQKQVVRNERRERLEDAMYGPADAQILKQLFPVGHAYREGVIGSADDIEKATLQDARAFFNDFYTTENATLVVSGDFETAQARAWISRYFGGIARRITATVERQAAPRISRARVLKVAVPLAEHPRISMVWAGPRLFGRGAAELELFAHLLSPSGANLLGRWLKDSQFDVRDVQVKFQSTIAGTWLELHVVAAAKPQDLAQLVKLVQRVLKSYVQSPLHATELSALARSLERYALFSLQSASNQARMLAVYDHLFLDPLRLRWVLQRFQKILPMGVQSTVRDFLLSDHRLVIYALPSKKRRQP